MCFLDVAPVVTILTFVFCHGKILLLSAELPQYVIPYFIIKWKYTKYIIFKHVCISKVICYLFSVYLQNQMFNNSQTKEFYICLYSIFYLYRKLDDYDDINKGSMGMGEVVPL